MRRVAANGDSLVLHGEAGVGKTALLEAAEEAAVTRGIPVIRTAGVEGGTDLAYAALHRLLKPFLPRLDELSPLQRGTLATALELDDGPPPDRLAVSNAMLSLLVLARGEGALLVIVDDLPWLDRMSAAVLAFVARRLDGPRIGFLGALRAGESSFFDGGGVAALEVMPIGQAAADDLIDQRFPGLAPRVRQQVLEEAAGNPLALLELPVRVVDRHHQRLTIPMPSLMQQLRSTVSALPGALLTLTITGIAQPSTAHAATIVIVHDYTEIVRESASTGVTCPTDQVLLGRAHSGDENGLTAYYCGFILIEGELVTVGAPQWSESQKESDSSFTAPGDQVSVGRLHSGDENGRTRFAAATLTVGGRVVRLTSYRWTETQREPYSFFKADAYEVMVGRAHSGDENGPTRHQNARIAG
ncbi:AAA family ATPase [Nonomuraea sp. NPDC047529]|uniref:AAA family ATPase n=1 Tax=Nonomuraea sp. NPDC047529 TaxID=3155623 RepID=UPI0033F420EF